MTAKRRTRATPPAGMLVRGGGKDGPQQIRTTGHRWSDAAETIFLDQLAASCNVTHAAAAAGFSAVAIYKRRSNDPAFARRWGVALAQGYARIEELLIRRATETLEDRAPDPDTPIPAMSVRDAIALLALHRAAVKGEGNHPGWRGRPRALDEVRDSILTKLEAIEAQRRADPAAS